MCGGSPCTSRLNNTPYYLLKLFTVNIMDLIEQARSSAAEQSKAYATAFMSKVHNTMEEGRAILRERAVETLSPVGSAIYGPKDFFYKINQPPAYLPHESNKSIRHPWMLYQNGHGWSVYPAIINGHIEPTIAGTRMSYVPAPIFSIGSGQHQFWFRFSADAESVEKLDGRYQLRPNSFELSGFSVSTSGGVTTNLSVNEETGNVTPGTYYMRIGVVTNQRVTAQDLHFNLHITLCGTYGGLSIQPYG